MELPAVTVCLSSLPFIFSFEARRSYDNSKITCHVLNGGRNSSGHSKEIHRTKTTGPLSGFRLQFFLPSNYLVFYYINDAHVEPTSTEIAKFLLPGTTSILILEKTIETKLEHPFNNCLERNNLPDISLVRQLSAANITYRKVNCVEICFLNFVQNYALKHNIGEDEAIGKEEVQNYDKDKNCNHLCPLECESSQYKIDESKFSMGDFSNSKEYSSQFIPSIQKNLNITVNSTEEFNKNFMDIKVFYDSLKYTKISQTPKTTLSALVSNLGGSTGLFLDLSFMSACRAIEFILGIIFKF